MLCVLKDGTCFCRFLHMKTARETNTLKTYVRMITNDLRMKKSGINWNNFCIYFSSSTWVGKKAVKKENSKRKQQQQSMVFPFISSREWASHAISSFQLARAFSSSRREINVSLFILPFALLICFCGVWGVAQLKEKLLFNGPQRKEWRGENWEMRNVHFGRRVFIHCWSVTSFDKSQKKIGNQRTIEIVSTIIVEKTSSSYRREAFRKKCSRRFYDVTVKTKSSSWVSAQAYQNKSSRGMVRVLLLDAWTDLSTQDSNECKRMKTWENCRFSYSPGLCNLIMFNVHFAKLSSEGK